MSVRDNLYLHVNGEWIDNAKIPEGKPAINAFVELNEEIEKTLMSDFDKMVSCEKEIADDRLKEFIKLYKLALDKETRDKEGAKPLQNYVDMLSEVKNYDEISELIKKMLKLNFNVPFSMYVYGNIGNSKEHGLYCGSASTILPNKEFYSNPNKDALLKVYEEMATELLENFFDKEKAEKIVKEAMKFDASFIEYIKSSEELADRIKQYNPRDIDTVKNYSSHIDLSEIILDVCPEINEVIITEPKYFENFDNFVNESSFELLKSWLLVNLICKNTQYLSEELRILGSKYSMAISGIAKPLAFKKFNYNKTTAIFDMVVGDYYARHYFGKESKENVIYMIKNMIEVYKDRLSKNDWLKKETANLAIEKLNKMDFLIGYPEKIRDVFAKLKVDENLTYFENMMNLGKVLVEDHFAKMSEPVDKKEWHMSPSMINAYYSPTSNIICFPAAILQRPFYNINQSISENYGGIGAVIAHEISHAFDNNGAKMDSDGNLNNWWDYEDYKRFEELTQKMIAQFDVLEVDGTKVNGTLTVSENIADLGGISCALEALKKEGKYNLEEFFYNWARVWRMKASKEYTDLLLSVDVHGPNVMRANMQPQNLDEFYETFGVKEGDKMFMKKEDRVRIW